MRIRRLSPAVILAVAAHFALSQPLVAAGAAEAHAASGVPPAPSPGQNWSSLDPDAIGSVRPLLVGGECAHPAPRKRIPWDRTVLRMPVAFVVAAGLPKMAILDAGGGKLELRTLDLDSGKLSDPIASMERGSRNPQLAAGPDGTSVIVQSGPGTPIQIYDLKEGKLRTTITPSTGAGQTSQFLVADASTLVVVDGANTIQRWDLSTGASKGTAAIQFDPKGRRIIPLACAAGALLAGALGGPDSAEPNQLLAIDLASGAVKATESAGDAPPCAADGSPILVVASTGSSGWIGMTTHRLPSLEQIASFRLKPVLQPIYATLLRGGTAIAAIENMVNAIVVWDTATGKPLAALPPEVGGSVGFAATADGATLVALSGPLVDGSVAPDHWAVYDLKTVFAGTNDIKPAPTKP